MTNEQGILKLIGAELKIKQIRVDRFTINYIMAGSGPNLLLIHGANIGWGQWYANIGELAKYFTVYAIDLPGAGGSTKIDFSKTNLENDFVRVVDQFIHLLDMKHTHLLGHSFGGWIVLKLAIGDRSFIEKIILVNSIGFTDYVPWRYRPITIYPIALLLSKTAMRPTRKNMKEFLTSVLYDSSVLKEEFIDYFHESVIRGGVSHPFLLINRLTRFFKMREELFLVDELAKIKRPTLIIIGEKDPLIPIIKHVERLRLIPGAQLELFLNTGHVPSLEKSTEFNDLIIRFLRT